MDLLQQFVIYLNSQKDKPSKITIKNYRSDVGQFIKWIEQEFNKPFEAKLVTAQIIEIYKKSRIYNAQHSISTRTLKRHLSSLRKFFRFLNIEVVQFSEKKKVKLAQDKWRLLRFKNYLYLFSLTSLTIKNYIIDIQQFLGWLEQVAGIKDAWKFSEKNIFDKIDGFVIKEYKQRLLTPQRLGGLGLSPRTINRKLASLRKYLNWAIGEGLLKAEWFKVGNEKIETKKFTPQAFPSSTPPQKTHTKYSAIPPIRLFQKSFSLIDRIFEMFLIIPIAQATEKGQYLLWKLKGKPIFTKSQKSKVKSQNYLAERDLASQDISKFKSFPSSIPKSFFAPLLISTRYLPWHKKALHHIRHTRPKWYKTYHLLPIAHYLHFSILIIFMSALGFGIYNYFIETPKVKDQAIASRPISSSRLLSFQGRITDPLNNPINIPTPVRIAIYTDKEASGSALVWQEVITVAPDLDGNFLATIGREAPIPQNIFLENSSLWLGITIDSMAEIVPRRELPTATHASNAQTLQGLLPITAKEAGTSNVILALDSSGNLSIGGIASPIFQATAGRLTISGTVLLLTTNIGSNANVEISPDGLGTIDLKRPLQNTTQNNNLASALGAVEIDDLFAVLATSSAAAVTINQDATGPILAASSSGTPRFTVENSGNLISVNGANWQPFADSLSSLNIASASGIPFVTFDSKNARVGIGQVANIDQALTINGNLAISPNSFFGSGKDYGSVGETSANTIQILNSTTKSMVFQTGTSGSGNIIFNTRGANERIRVEGGSGNLGIGTTSPLFRLDVQESQAATAAAQIFNTNTGTDADGLLVKLGNTSTTAVASTNNFISFETSGIGIVGSIKGSGGKGVTYATSGIADFAEYFKKDEKQIIEYGSLVCIDEKGLVLPCDQTNTKMVGIASEQPAFLGGENQGNKSIAVGLVGQVYTKVSSINGTIKPGDLLTYSSIPGVAVKAVGAGPVIGRALEGYDGIGEIGGIGKVLVSISMSWYDPDVYLTSTGDLSITAQQFKNLAIQQSASQTGQIAKLLNGYIVKNTAEQIVKRIGAFAEIIVANLEAGKIVSPVAEISEIRTNIISPLASNSLVIHLGGEVGTGGGKLIVENASGSAVATIDSQGNASFSGTLKSSDLQVLSDASISGTLRAKNIIADSIEGLSARVSTLAAEYIKNAPDESLNVSFGTFTQSLMAFGTTSLSDASIVGQLSIGGRMFFTASSLNVLGSDFEIQPLRQGGVSFLGLVRIDENGNLKVSGEAEFVKDVTIRGKLSTNIISPIPDSDLVIHLTSGSFDSSVPSIIVKNASGSAVLSINQSGDLISSGSGTFSKLNLTLAKEALALSQTELIATGSAGVAVISRGHTEVTLKNKLVTDRSLVYITPVGTPSAQALFLIRQGVEEFSVGTQNETASPFPFNWLIVN